jgi:SSS family solute:Na+ symporter
MDLHLVDWAIVASLLFCMAYAVRKTRRFSTDVADFLVANRCADRYVLGVSQGITNIGAISVVAWFEAYYVAGFSFAWWFLVQFIVQIFISLSGWVVYRYRQTRAMTLAQFFEMRYSRRFRIFAGLIIFLAGILNMGIFPAVGARFFVYFCNLPTYDVTLVGGLQIELTHALLMAVLLAISLVFVFTGGLVTVMVTNFIQGTFFNVFLCIVTAFIFIKVPWSQFATALSQKPPGESMLHPFQTANTKDFNMAFFLITGFQYIYGCMAWQGTQGYFAAASNAHEARMGQVMGFWRTLTQQLMIMILPIGAFVLMHQGYWSANAASVNEQLSTFGNETVRAQVTTTLILNRFLPTVLMGGFCAVMLSAMISTHQTYMHSWGSIFIQDVVMPFRKKPLEPKQHIRLLRWSIGGVGVFVFLFSLLWPQNQPILMFMALSAIMWLGGAGAAIIGGLYWKRGTTAAAYTGVIYGIGVSVFGIVMRRVWPAMHGGDEFPINSQYLLLIAMVGAAVLYVLVSLLGKRQVHNMDKLLHRGKYAISTDATEVVAKEGRGLVALLGVGRDFNLKDKLIYLSITGWTIIWSLIFVVVSIYNVFYRASTESWMSFWHFYVWMIFIVGVGTTVWLTAGGIMDIKKMFERLAERKKDSHDDGWVEKNESAE